MSAAGMRNETDRLRACAADTMTEEALEHLDAALLAAENARAVVDDGLALEVEDIVRVLEELRRPRHLIRVCRSNEILPLAKTLADISVPALNGRGGEA